MKKFFQFDPRIYQISVLSSLILYGFFFLDFEIKPELSILIIATVLASQYICTILFDLPKFDPKSCLISGLSLCLLLRTNSLFIAVLCAAITISSKFIFRFNNKHMFNPTNFGLVLMIILTNGVWVSPGQWGNAAIIGFFIACIGGLVANRASRSDVTYAFLFFYTIMIFGRAIWLGDPLSIPLHQLQNGAFLIFTFFMISDPKTTPDSRKGRILFAFLVASGACFINFVLFRTNGLLWSLAFFAMFVPLIDLFLPGIRYQWKKLKTKPLKKTQEVFAR